MKQKTSSAIALAYRAVRPQWSVWSTAAPADSSRCTHSACPRAEATISAVHLFDAHTTSIRSLSRLIKERWQSK